MPGEALTADELLALAMDGKLDLDTGAERQEPVTPTNQADTTTDDPTNTGDAGEKAAGTQEDEQPAPIASKSGAYSIPYDKLVEARTERDHYKSQLAAREAQLAEREAQLTQLQQANLQKAQEEAQGRADAGQNATQADANLAAAQAAMNLGVDMALFGDFSEEAIAKGIEQLVVARVNAAMAPVLQERQQQQAQSASEAHIGAILGKHPDAVEIVESGEWQSWLQGQPAFVRAAIDQTMEKGSAEQVNEVFDSFKQSQGGQSNKGSASALLDAMRNAKEAVPNTLTDLPGAIASKSGPEQLAAATGDPTALLDLMSGKSPEEITRLMDSVS